MADTPGRPRFLDDGLNSVFALGREQLEAIAALGFHLYEQGRTREAETIFDGLIALDSHTYLGYAGLGAIALADEKLEQAIELLTRAARLNPGDPSVHANLGEALLRQAKFDDAAAEFERALALDPEQRDPGANRARALLSGLGRLVAELERAQRKEGG